MANNYIKDYLNQGAAPSAEDIFVISSAVRRAFLHVPSVYDIDTVNVHFGHYDPKKKQAFLDSFVPGEHPFRESVVGTFYGDGPDSFGPLERDGVDYTDAKPHNSGGDYAEAVECIIMEEPFSSVVSAPAKGFSQDMLYPSGPFKGALAYYFSGDDRLAYLPHSSLWESNGTLGEFVLSKGEVVKFNLMRQRSALRRYLGGESMAIYEAMGRN